MTRLAWKMLTHKPPRLLVAWAGLGVLFFLSAAQTGLLVGWCHSCSAIVRHADAHVWVMAEQTQAFDYGTPIPVQRVYQARSVEGVAHADAMIMAWNTWQRADGKRVNIELVGLDRASRGVPWAMRAGTPAAVHEPDGVIVDELFLDALGVRGVADEAELYGRRAVVRGVSADVRTLTASPFVFTSIDAARRYDRRYGPDEVTYGLIRCAPGHTPAAVRDRLRAALPHVEVLTTGEFAARTMSYWMLETGLGLTVVLTAVLGLAVGVVITSQTLFTITSEHLSDYAALAALGFRRRQLLGCVSAQGLILAAGGIAVGSLLYAAVARASARTPLPLDTLPAAYAGLAAVSVASNLAGGFLSLRLIVRIDPASVFRG